MWKLKVSEGWETSENDHVGRQYWKFDTNLTPSEEEKAQIQKFCNEFYRNRFRAKHSSDLLMRFQVSLIYINLYLCFSYFFVNTSPNASMY